VNKKAKEDLVSIQESVEAKETLLAWPIDVTNEFVPSC
jgi:hypothetical protein